MDVKTILGEISVRTEEAEDKTYHKFLLESAEGLYTVEAVSCSITTSDTDIFESPLNKI